MAANPKMSIKIIKILLFFITIIFISLVSLRFYIHDYLTTSNGTRNEAVTVEVERGLDFTRLSYRLAKMGVIAHPRLFVLIGQWNGIAEHIKAGEYEFSASMSPLEIMQKLTDGTVKLYSFTVPEGTTIHEISMLWAEKGFGTAIDFAIELQHIRTEGLEKPETGWEGYLYPDTYFFPKETTPEILIRKMLKRFQEVFTPIWQQCAGNTELTLHQIITLASLIEKESKHADERSIISSVFHNRLSKGMPLQCDPTVIFLLGEQYRGKLFKKDLKIDHPYNTYTHSGLPPGPIANPGVDSIRAACFPDQTSYLYFVSDNAGGHIFSETLADHNRAVERYRQLSREESDPNS